LGQAGNIIEINHLSSHTAFRRGAAGDTLADIATRIC
jgi:hypothetical protein